MPKPLVPFVMSLLLGLFGLGVLGNAAPVEA